MTTRFVLGVCAVSIVCVAISTFVSALINVTLNLSPLGSKVSPLTLDLKAISRSPVTSTSR